MKKILFIILLLISSSSLADWTIPGYSGNSPDEVCDQWGAWAVDTYSTAETWSVGDYVPYNDVPRYMCDTYSSTGSLYTSTIAESNLTDNCPLGTTFNVVTRLCDVINYDCFGLFNDLSPDAGDQCTCGDGFLPNFSSGGVADCDGRNKVCATTQQTVQTIIDGHTVNSCQNTSVCDPETDPNGCQALIPSACISTDPNDPCLGDGLTLDGEVPNTCPDGYYLSGNDCLPVTSQTTTTNTNTGESTTTTTVNNGDNTSLSFSSTSTLEGDQTNPDLDGDGVVEGEDEDTGEKTASGGGDCGAPPACSGDAIECAILEQEWLLRCDSPNELLNMTPDSFDLNGQLITMQTDLDTAKTDFSIAIDAVQTDVTSFFNFSAVSGGGVLPVNVVNLYGSDVDFGIARFSDELSAVGTAIIALSLIISVIIVMRI